MTATPSLSICLLTRGPAEAVAALLELVRPLADELVVGVDDRAGPGTLETCAGLADRAYSLEVGAPAHVLGWLFHECTRDWILRLDDDEVPSGPLLDELPATLASTRATNVMIPRRWLHPDPASYIATRPWTPDYQLRLVRNVPGIWRFPGLRHDNLEVLGERHFAELPIYHLDLLANDLDARQRKRERYEADRPGHTAGGFPINAMYTPETVPGVETVPVPESDRERILRALSPPARPRPESSASWTRVERAEAERFHPGRELSPTDYQASVELVRGLPGFGGGETHLVEVEVTNLGGAWWPPGEQASGIRVSSRWLGQDGAGMGEGPRAPFTEAVAPGATTRVLAPVRAPAWPGVYTLELDVMHEGVRWFGRPARAAARVEPSADRTVMGVPADPGSDGFLARIEPPDGPIELDIGERARARVRLHNTGSRTWDSEPAGTAPTYASCRWVDARGVVVVTDAPRTGFAAPVEPGQSTEVELDVAAPVRQGRYAIEIDLVEEGRRWCGSAETVEVLVRAPAGFKMRRRSAHARGRVRSRLRRGGRIPPILHRIWVGGEPLPAEFEWYGETWRRHHPAWEMRLWTDEEVRGVVPQRLLRRARSHSEASNVIRYEVLRRYGGVYVDTDVECRRPIEPLLEGVRALAAWETPYRLGTAVLASAPHHPVFETAAREARLTIGLGLNNVEATGPGFFSQVVAELPLIAAYGREVFYPYRWDEPHRRFEQFPDSYAVHHWAQTWVTKEPV